MVLRGIDVEVLHGASPGRSNTYTVRAKGFSPNAGFRLKSCTSDPTISVHRAGPSKEGCDTVIHPYSTVFSLR